jgi:hypothetical protein
MRSDSVRENAYQFPIEPSWDCPRRRAYSALKRLPVQAGVAILGDLSIQGNIKLRRSCLKTGEHLQLSHAPEEARGQCQPASRRALAGGEPATKGMMIHTDSGGHDDLALVRFS